MIPFVRLTLTPFLLLSALALQIPAQTQPADDTSNPETTSAVSHKLVGYYPQWGVYDAPPYNVKNVITSGSATLLTQLIYAFANIVDNKCASYDTWADYQDPLPAGETVNGKADVSGEFAGNFHQLKELKELQPKLENLISIGGGSLNPSIFSKAAEPANRKTFVSSCIDMFIKGQFAKGISEPGIFTGIDLDWEFPASDADETNFLALLKEFRDQLNALDTASTHYVLTSTAGASSYQWQYVDLKAAQQYVNFFNAMMYDFDGSWSNETGFVAPLYQGHLDPDPTNNANYAIEQYIGMGVEKSKIVFGMPFYAYHWTKVSGADYGLFQDGDADQGSYQYNQIGALKGYTEYRGTITHAPWLYSQARESFWTFDDPDSLKFKTRYAMEKGLGGVMFWELSGDTKDGTLIKALAGSL
jgi:chitinase